jgi:hypothetical protein
VFTQVQLAPWVGAVAGHPGTAQSVSAICHLPSLHMAMVGQHLPYRQLSPSSWHDCIAVGWLIGHPGPASLPMEPPWPACPPAPAVADPPDPPVLLEPPVLAVPPVLELPPELVPPLFPLPAAPPVALPALPSSPLPADVKAWPPHAAATRPKTSRMVEPRTII